MTIPEYKKYLAAKNKLAAKSQSPKAPKKPKKEIITQDNVQDKLFILACKECGLPEPKTEFMFAKELGRKWRCDFYFEHNGIKLAVEKEGGIWTEGRHTRAKGFLEDMKKYNTYSMLGIYLVRFSTQQMEEKRSECIEIIKQVLCEKNIGKICLIIKK